MAAIPPSISRPHPPSQPPHDLEITIISAKHLKNVNWRNGDLKPYVIFWVDPDRRQASKPDESGSTRPVWNERFLLPLTLPPRDSILTLEIFHSRPSDTPKPLVGTLQLELGQLLDDSAASRIFNLELKRPSGRPHGKIRLKLALRERPAENYPIAPPANYYYAPTPAPPPSVPQFSREYRAYSYAPNSHPPPAPVAPPPPSPPPPQSYSYDPYSDPYSGYYTGYYAHSQVPAQNPRPFPPPPRPVYNRQSSYGASGTGPSAPVDYAIFDHRNIGGGRTGMGVGTGLAVGAVAGALGGLALEEGLKHEEEKIAERVDNDLPTRDGYYSDYDGRFN